MAASWTFSSGLPFSSSVTKLDGNIPCEIVFIRLFETNLGVCDMGGREREEKRKSNCIKAKSESQWIVKSNFNLQLLQLGQVPQSERQGLQLVVI
jgi:hypothetical protein